MVLSMVKWMLPAIFSILHPYFISVVQLEHNAKEKSIEISVRIFTEDLEATLTKTTGQKIDFLHPANKAAIDKAVADYFSRHLKLTVNNRPVNFEFVGYELQSESTWTYLEIKNIPSLQKLDVQTDILYEFTKDQSNIIQVKANNDKNSFRLDYPKTSTSFVF